MVVCWHELFNILYYISFFVRQPETRDDSAFRQVIYFDE